jgi:hypothetical protein
MIMKIDRTNYEIWFTDWLKNTLSESQIEELNRFLENNPDLLEEFISVSSLKLLPDSSMSFKDKEQLKRSAEEVSSLQFDLLCAAYHENDLSDAQVEEIESIIRVDPEKERTFRLIAKSRLSPPKTDYKNKYRLKHTNGRIIRLAFTAISAAASVAIFVLLFFQKPNVQNPASLASANSTIINNPAEIRAAVPVIVQEHSAEKENASEVKKIDSSSPIQKQVPSSQASTIKNETKISKVFYNVSVPLIAELPRYELAESVIAYKEPDFDDGRSHFEKFVAKTFRKSLLHENAPADSPIKAFEIAEAGVSGINKLLGWDMALTRNTDVNGDITSVKFNSRMVKFNAPVKKNERSQ